ncbi:MAG: DUF4738 domain-containing protein, partial [Fusobacteriaceae bacterium]
KNSSELDSSKASTVAITGPMKDLNASDSIQKDTVIGKYQISYKSQSNKHLFIPRSRYENNETDTTSYYGDRDIILNLKKDGKYILKNRKITRTDFRSYMDDNETMVSLLLTYFRVERVESDRIVFFIAYCIPDTGGGHWFELTITDKGEESIEELDVEST